MVRLNIGFGGLDVYIEANGERLEEFGLHTAEGTSKQTCYVASVENASFSVNACSLQRPLGDQAIRVFVDGVAAGVFILKKGRRRDFQLEGFAVSETQERTLHFGNLLLNEEDDSADGLDTSIIHSELGTIRVELHAIQINATRYHARPHFSANPINLPGDTPISEKAKKAGAHAARLGQARTAFYAGSFPTFRFAYLKEPPMHGPLPTISVHRSAMRALSHRLRLDVTFHYAPLDFLRARGIVPRSQVTESEAMEVEMEIIPAVKSEEIENTASGFAAGPSTSAPRNRGPAEVIVVSDDDDEGGDSDESDDLTPEERVELARLQAKKQETSRKGKGKQKARSPVVKRAKSEIKDVLLNSNEVIVLSD